MQTHTHTHTRTHIHNIKSKLYVTIICFVHVGTWGPWSPWLPCSVPCGVGTQRRFRVCEANACSGSSSGTIPCLQPPCSGLIFILTSHNNDKKYFEFLVHCCKLHLTILCSVDYVILSIKVLMRYEL